VIQKIYKKLSWKFELQHVKSHQDDNAPATTLSLETQLNIEADRLATEYMKEDTQRRPLVPLFSIG
jgi:hypothetical protein